MQTLLPLQLTKIQIISRLSLTKISPMIFLLRIILQIPKLQFLHHLHLCPHHSLLHLMIQHIVLPLQFLICHLPRVHPLSLYQCHSKACTTTGSFHGYSGQSPNPKYALYVAYNPTLCEPTWYSQAVKQVEWREAMGTEFNALQQNGTWSLVPPKQNMNIRPNKWVFKIK